MEIALSSPMHDDDAFQYIDRFAGTGTIIGNQKAIKQVNSTRPWRASYIYYVSAPPSTFDGYMDVGGMILNEALRKDLDFIPKYMTFQFSMMSSAAANNYIGVYFKCPDVEDGGSVPRFSGLTFSGVIVEFRAEVDTTSIGWRLRTIDAGISTVHSDFATDQFANIQSGDDYYNARVEWDDSTRTVYVTVNGIQKSHQIPEADWNACDHTGTQIGICGATASGNEPRLRELRVAKA